MSGTILIGYYGQHNAGDDAFLLSTAWGVRSFLKVGDIYAAAANLPKTHGIPVRRLYFPRTLFGISLRGVRYLDRLRELYVVPRVKSVAFGGGSIFHTTSIIERYIDLLDRVGQGPHYAFGVGVGPFRQPDAAKRCSELFSRLSFVGVRDLQSFERARCIAPPEHVVLTFDLAPLLWRATSTQTLLSRDSRQGLGIALRSPKTQESDTVRLNEEHLDQLAAALLTCFRSGRLDVVYLMDMSSNPRHPDGAVHQALADRLRGKIPTEHVPYNGDPVATMHAVASLRAMVAVRLHAAVFAFCGRTPTLILGYHEKCRGWASMVGHPEPLFLPLEQIDEQSLLERIELLLATNAPLAIMRPEEAESRALKNFHLCQGSDG